MKKFLFLLLTIITHAHGAGSSAFMPVESPLADESNLHNYSSQFFMFTRPAMHNLAAEQSLWHRHMYNKVGRVRGSLQIVPLFEQSFTTCDDHLNDAAGAYFLPFCKRQILVAGGTSPFQEDADVRAEWLGLPSNFSGRLSLSPEQSQLGGFIEYQQDFGEFIKGKMFDHLWIAAVLPVLVVKNDLRPRQTDVLNPGVGAATNILTALNNPAYLYSKIDGQQKQVGVGELILKLGANFYSERNFEVDYYNFLTIPTSSAQNPSYVFSPFLSNNNHWGVGAGVNFQFPLTEDETEVPILFFLNAQHTYLIRNKQCRTFDLIGKPWSRYMLYNSMDCRQQNVPGVNILTRRVKARPGSFVDLSTGFRTGWKGIELEVGYDLWAHGDERISLLPTFCPTCNEEVILEDYGIAGTAPGTSASKATINTFYTNNGCLPNVVNDSSFVPLTTFDLDLQSGAAAAALTHKVHGALGFSHKGKRMEAFLGVGGFGEFPQNNPALKRWGVWGKAGFSI